MTDIFISRLLGGETGKIHEAWRAGKFILIVSHAILSEYLDVLHRPKLHLTPDVITAIVERVYRRAEFVTPTTSIHAIEADPTDSKFLEAAVGGQASHIVSGDDHLLALKSYRDIKIIRAGEFMAQWK